MLLQSSQVGKATVFGTVITGSIPVPVITDESPASVIVVCIYESATIVNVLW